MALRLTQSDSQTVLVESTHGWNEQTLTPGGAPLVALKCMTVHDHGGYMHILLNDVNLVVVDLLLHFLVY